MSSQEKRTLMSSPGFLCSFSSQYRSSLVFPSYVCDSSAISLDEWEIKPHLQDSFLKKVLLESFGPGIVEYPFLELVREQLSPVTLHRRPIHRWELRIFVIHITAKAQKAFDLYDVMKRRAILGKPKLSCGGGHVLEVDGGNGETRLS